MAKINRVLFSLILAFVLVSAVAYSDDEVTQDATIEMLHDFISAFNTHDFDTMQSFYQTAASTSFNERRSQEENRKLYQQMTDLFGKLTFKRIDSQGSEGILLVVGASVPGSAANFRFKLAGDPARIDGFMAGIPPRENEDERSTNAGTMADHADQAGPFGFLTSAKGVYQSQLVIQSDGSLLLVWVQKGSYDLDLFVARQQQDGQFARPVRVNQQGLNRYTGDEARPSVAVDSEGAVAIAWTARNNDIMLAVSSNYGEVFNAPQKLNQDEGEAERTMPSVAISPDGSVHTVWLDPREAPKGMEEPSDLYYASLYNGALKETNLTANQELTVCGCCRPYIAIDDSNTFDIVFRNASAGGYRDISRIVGTNESLGEPQPTSPPIWKLNACPSAGPIVSRGGTLWKDASTGDWRMLWSVDASAKPTELFADRNKLELTYSPRTVSGREDWVLVGAKPFSMITTRKNGSWQIVRDDLPHWASSAVVINDQLILIGNEKGQLYTATEPL